MDDSHEDSSLWDVWSEVVGVASAQDEESQEREE
jgi:hypothetical protein